MAKSFEIDSDLKVSSASENDLVEVSVLVNSAYRGDSSRAGWTTEADFLDGQRTDPESLRKHLENPRQTILCLRNKDESLLGCVSLERTSSHQDLTYYLGMLTISPTLQSQGIGRILLEKSEDFVRKLGAKRMILGVIQLRVELISWYERRGYRKTGETQPFPYNDIRAGIPKRDDLHFIMFEKIL